MKKLKFKVGDNAVMTCEVGDLVKGEKVKVRQVDATNGASFPYFCWSKESRFGSWMRADAIKPLKKPKYKHLQKQIDRLKKEVEGLKRDCVNIIGDEIHRLSCVNEAKDRIQLGKEYKIDFDKVSGEPCPGTMDALNEISTKPEIKKGVEIREEYDIGKGINQPCEGMNEAMSKSLLSIPYDPVLDLNSEHPTELKKGDIAAVLEDNDNNFKPGEAIKIIEVSDITCRCRSLVVPDKEWYLLKKELKHINDFK